MILKHHGYNVEIHQFSPSGRYPTIIARKDL